MWLGEPSWVGMVVRLDTLAGSLPPLEQADYEAKGSRGLWTGWQVEDRLLPQTPTILPCGENSKLGTLFCSCEGI